MGYVVKQYTLQSSGYQEPLALTISLSLTTISSIYLVSVCTEGLRTLRLDRRRPPDACCSLTWSGLSSSSPSPPLPSHSLSSVQSGHIKKQSCRQLGKYYFLRKIISSSWLKTMKNLIFKVTCYNFTHFLKHMYCYKSRY